MANDQGLPVDWTFSATPGGTAKFTLDQEVFLVGKAALRVAVPDTGAAAVSPKPVPVEGERGTWSPSGIARRLRLLRTRRWRSLGPPGG